jgi:putative DNA primase/helicase
VTNVEEALRLADRGIPVFPCRLTDEIVNGKNRKAKSPLTVHGHKDATTDEAAIRSWWRRYPKALVGVPTGKVTGIFVVDVDPDGFDWYEENRSRLYGPRVHRTKRGGYHLIYKYPEGSGFTVGVKQIAEGVDHRSDGGYIIWWPAHGCDIEIKKKLSSLEDLPGWVLDALTRAGRGGSRRANGNRGTASSFTPQRDSNEQIVEGGRNDALTRLAGKMRRQGASPSELEAALLAFNRERCDPSLPDDEVRAIADSVARYEPEPEDRRHDWGNAERLAAHAKDVVRYEPRQKSFYVWDGTRWCIDHGEHRVSKLAVESAKKMLDEAVASTDLTHQKKLLDWFRTSLHEGRIRGAVELLKNFVEIHVEAATLDADPFLLGVTNGVVDLRTGEVYEPQQRDLITKSAGCAFDPKAKCPRWTQFVTEIAGGDEELVRYLQELVGYTLTGDTSGQMLMFLYGTGHNGKSVFVETVRDLLGEYGMSMRTEALSLKAMSSKNGPSEDIARLRGARMVTVNETSEGMRFDESLVKDLTGEDTVAARFLHKGTFEYRPAFKISIRGNHQPEFNGADGGMARRVRLIPFEVNFSGKKDDPQLKAKLRSELPGILNWAIEGALRWQRAGRIETPAKVVEATSEYVDAMDGLAEFIDEVLIRDKAAQTTTAAIFKAYEQWARYREGIRLPLTKHRLALRIKGRGFRPTKFRAKGKEVRGFTGVRIRSEFSRGELSHEDEI